MFFVFSILFICCLLFVGSIFSKLFFGLLLWLVIKLPVFLVLATVGIVLCCTIFLIPLGVLCFRMAGGILMPAV